MKKKKLMILGASDLQLEAYLQANKMGIETIGVDMNPNAVALKYADHKEIVSTIDYDGVLEAAIKYNIDGIMTLASDMPMQTVAKISKELHLPGIDIDTAIRATDKLMMRKALQKNNVPIPRFFEVIDYENYMEVIKKFTSLFIVKPSDNSGSRGIYAVTDISDTKMITEAFQYSKKYSRSGYILVEELMYGDEVSVESFTQNGKTSIVQITDKKTTGMPYFVEIGHSQPSHYPEETINRIKYVTELAIEAIGIDNAASHTEIKITSEGPKIVEIGARLGGGCITTDLVPLSTGVNMVRASIDLALGNKINIEPTIKAGSAISFFYGEKGTINKISGVEEAQKIAGVKKIVFLKTVGDEVNDLKNGSDRFGYVIVQEEDEEKAIELCKSVKKSINIEIK